MASIQRVTLMKKERLRLEGMLRKGRWTPRQLKRAHILLFADEKKQMSNSVIAERLFCSRETVRQVRYRFIHHGLDAALSDLPRPGQPKKITQSSEKFLISLYLEKPPTGHEIWTLPLLRKKLRMEKGTVVSTETVRRVLLRYVKEYSKR